VPAAAAPAAQPPLTPVAPLATSATPALPTLPALQGAAAGAPTPVPTAPGAADAGSRVGQDVATPPALPASAPPRLNLQLARPRGGELSRGGSAGMLPLLPRPPEVDDKLGKAIDKAGKSDCRNAYGGAGLLAVVPLAVDALRKDGGCKW
jgi:hypothetical protein